MFTNTTVAGVAMLFAAVIVAHPGPSFASSHVDAAMGVMPSLPAGMGTNLQGGGYVGMEKSDEDDEKPASQGIGFPGQNVGMEMCCDPDDERSVKMGTALPGATKGIIINNMPGSPGMLSAGKVSRGLKGPPAEHKVMPYKALQK